MSLSSLLCISRFGVVSNEGFILLPYHPNKIFIYEDVKSINLKKRVIRKYQILMVFFSIFFLIYSLDFIELYLLFINVLISVGFIVVSKFVALKKYELCLKLVSGELITFNVKSSEVGEVKKYLNAVSKNLKKSR